MKEKVGQSTTRGKKLLTIFAVGITAIICYANEECIKEAWAKFHKIETLILTQYRDAMILCDKSPKPVACGYKALKRRDGRMALITELKKRRLRACKRV